MEATRNNEGKADTETVVLNRVNLTVVWQLPKPLGHKEDVLCKSTQIESPIC